MAVPRYPRPRIQIVATIAAVAAVLAAALVLLVRHFEHDDGWPALDGVSIGMSTFGRGGATTSFGAPVADELRATIGGLRGLPGGEISCPEDTGGVYVLRFHSADGPAPTVVVRQTGCRTVLTTVRGKDYGSARWDIDGVLSREISRDLTGS